MVEIKDKVITVECLKEVHDYNKRTYVAKADIIPIKNGGTGSSNGATGLANLFASGDTVLSSHQYGDELPAAGTAGRIFFKRLTDI